MHGAERAGRAGEDPLVGGAEARMIGDTDRCGGRGERDRHGGRGETDRHGARGETETVAPLCGIHELVLEAAGPGETDREFGCE